MAIFYEKKLNLKTDYPGCISVPTFNNWALLGLRKGKPKKSHWFHLAAEAMVV